MKLWGGRFQKETNNEVEIFTASIDFDQQLAKVDILGSLAHVTMLGQCHLLDKASVDTLGQGLKQLLKKIEQGKVEYTIRDEDIHMNIERLLFDEVGEVAGKLHTGRSRNDQVALDTHLYLREQLIATLSLITQLQQALMQQAKQHMDTLLPGYTHLQRAQPVSFAHHLLCYAAMLQRDASRLMDSWPRINTMPLGAGALAGSSHPIDREAVATLLGFDSLYENSMDAVSDRDFIVEFIAHGALIMTHLSRLSEELILWSSQEFNFISLDESYTTGSSMMPQKKNPDVPELVRGKTGRVFGALMGILTLLKGLPLTYNKDMQEDKEGLFDTVKTLTTSLSIYASMIATMQVNQKVMHQACLQDFSNATRLADYLVAKGMPFRKAHTTVGLIVNHCIQQACSLSELPLDQYQTFYAGCEQSLYALLSPEAIVNSSQVRGGTAKQVVALQITDLETKLNTTTLWIKQHQANIEHSYQLLK